MARRASRTSFESRHDSPAAASSRGRGFTIVELLIVIVVIAILAAITIVAYNGIQDRAKASAAQAAAKQAYTTIAGYAVEHADTYPADLATAGLANSGDTSYQYRVDNAANPKTFCLTTTKNSVSYFVSNSASSPTAGGCAGHDVNGVAAITNLARLTQSSSSSRFATEVGNGAATFSWPTSGGPAGVSYQRATVTTAATSGSYVHGLSWTSTNALTAGTTYTWSNWVRASLSVVVAPVVFYSGTGNSSCATPTVTPNSWTRVSCTFVPTSSGTVYAQGRISNATTLPTGATFDAAQPMLTQGSELYGFADGDSNGWIWNGTPNNSTSTGPPL
ncbi:prepilin-type N-terminal cleavage/methylation domain-containing protein [Microbacterium schleiferi]|uniref:prepilin-type N-terminal cleavage/methylation domain-containing protein n=1 Tax=Microbacterium schleiferi TaxID=69362 RepID=UPI001D1775C1|nr:prepilin-type N-terminal cleavage/methylation domain-containing protein [Microbacterium schleiferi]MCC4268022.1 prepilin-type N-terminal cleavage/methylation domain-containing protein [Microbacterium schleiferi]